MASKSAIHFFSEEIFFYYRGRLLTRKWIILAINNESKRVGEINFVFCSDLYLATLNKQFLNHDTYTDILTFPGDNSENRVSGDIFISIDRVKENSIKFEQDFLAELHRIMIHGVLHLIGYKDKGRLNKEIMTKKEDDYLRLLSQIES